MLVIPTRNDLSNYTIQVELLSILYTLGFTWNTRDQHWYLDIMDEESEPILMGQKLVGDWKITKRFSIEALPDGYFFTVDLTGNQRPPGRDTLGEEVGLIFIANSEIES